MKIFALEDNNTFDIEFARSSGEESLKCPVCSSDRKKTNLKTFSWNHDKSAGKCHHCNERFVVWKEYKKKYIRPEFANNTKLSDNVVGWFDKRGISQFTLRKLNITEGEEWMPQIGKEVNTIKFNYFKDGDLINIKYRDAYKNFKLFKDAELIPYNIDGIKNSETAIIVEGEIDALTLWECGFHNVVSVPNGSNWDWLDNSIDYFDDKERIVLATDADIPGVKLRNELASRLGIERCYKVDFDICKDANEYLNEHGKEKLIDVINNQIPFPIEGVFSLNDVRDELDILFEEGLKPGEKTGIVQLDNHLTYSTSRLYTITGIPGHGKSEILDFILCRLNIMSGWKIGYFSPENHPMEWHLSKIIEKISGDKFGKMPRDLYRYTADYVNDNFFFVNPEDNYDIDNILEKARYLVRRKGIRAFVIDPYNKLEHQLKSSQSETNYISEFLDKVLRFAKINDVAMFLVAHPRKMGKDGKKYEIPTLYDISGSANFYNKTDFGITVYRDFEGGFVSVYVQKVKFKHMGEEGYTNFIYNTKNGRIDFWNNDSDRSTVKYDNSCWIDFKKEYPDPDKFIEPNTIFDGTTEAEIPY